MPEASLLQCRRAKDDAFSLLMVKEIEMILLSISRPISLYGKLEMRMCDELIKYLEYQ